MMEHQLQTGEPSISVIVPTLHEAETINSLIGHIRNNLMTQSCDIIVVDGSPDRDTIEAIQDVGVRTFHTTSPSRALQMNTGAKQATSPILLFLHADTFLPPDAFSMINSALSDPSISGGAFSLGTDSTSRPMKLIAALTTLRSRLTRIPYGDQAIFIRTEVFGKLGGFKEIPIMEDLEFMRRLRRSGYQINILTERVTTSSRRWEKEGAIRCTLRNWYIRARYICGTPPEKLIKYYDKHQTHR